MDAVVEVDVGNSGPLLGVASVEKQPGTGFGQQFITLKVRDA